MTRSRNSREILESDLAYNDAGLKRDRQLVRLAALLHDVGHGPFSHAAEELLPTMEEGGPRYKHEHYSAAIVRHKLRSCIEDHALNANYGFKADDVAALLEGSARAKQSVFWRDLIDGQMDADRVDYLLRDSYHAGVQYGRYDLHRVIGTTLALKSKSGQGPRLGITEGGIHAAEALVLARYFMFTQVYFHKTRVAYDIHLREALKTLLPGSSFPPPSGKGLNKYLDWDDWRVLGLLAAGKGGDHGRRLATRDHYREIYHTPEVGTLQEMKKLDTVKDALAELLAAEETASKSWYKTGDPDIPVADRRGEVAPLSRFSSVVKNLSKNNQVLLYARREDKSSATERVHRALNQQ